MAEDNVINFPQEEIQELKDNQDRNKFIADRQDTFFNICNKILDMLYDAKDRNDIKPGTFTAAEMEDTQALIDDIESIRKLIHLGAPLEDVQIARLMLCIQFIATDMMRLARDYAQAANTLMSYVKILN